MDISRHQKIFNPDAFQHELHVIGAGAMGSRIVMALARLGLSQITVYDNDRVESHNLANQLYRVRDIGKPKVVALAEIVEEATNAVIDARHELFNGTQSLSGVVFALTDEMSSRRQIFEAIRDENPWVRLLIETRMGTDVGRVYTVRPLNPDDARCYAATLSTDEQAMRSMCGTPVNIAATADIIAGHAIWALIDWTARENGAKRTLASELMLGTSPAVISTRLF